MFSSDSIDLSQLQRSQEIIGKDFYTFSDLYPLQQKVVEISLNNIINEYSLFGQLIKQSFLKAIVFVWVGITS